MAPGHFLSCGQPGPVTEPLTDSTSPLPELPGIGVLGVPATGVPAVPAPDLPTSPIPEVPATAPESGVDGDPTGR